MFLSILQKTILISLSFTLQMTFSWKTAVPRGWIPSSILTACCYGIRCSWVVALAAATAEPVGRWKVTWHLTSIRLWWILSASQAHAGSNVTASHVGKRKSHHNLSETVTHRGHSPNAIMFIAQFQSFVRISTVIYQSDRNWPLNPAQGSGGFLFCSLSLNCVLYLHCIAWHYLSNT